MSLSCEKVSVLEPLSVTDMDSIVKMNESDTIYRSGCNLPFMTDAANADEYDTTDALGQVSRFRYDANGNRKSLSNTLGSPYLTEAAIARYDDANRLIQRGDTTYAYDANGNRISKTGPQGTTTYSWDSRNRLTGITAPNGSQTTFRYDAFGNLLSQQAPGPVGDQTTRYLTDDLSNVVRQTISSGSITQTFSYEPYGQSSTPTTTTFPIQYTGRLPVSDGLYYYRARFYDPVAGRFLSEDPIGLAGGINLFAYVGGNPVGFIDPLGLAPLGSATISIGAQVGFGTKLGPVMLGGDINLGSLAQTSGESVGRLEQSFGGGISVIGLGVGVETGRSVPFPDGLGSLSDAPFEGPNPSFGFDSRIPGTSGSSSVQNGDIVVGVGAKFILGLELQLNLSEVGRRLLGGTLFEFSNNNPCL